MKKQTNFIKRGSAVLLSGALVLAFSPAVFAPTAFAASTTDYSLISVDAATTMIQTALEQDDLAKNSDDVIRLYDNVILKNKAEDALSNDQLQYIIECESYQLKLAQADNKSLKKQVKSLEKQLKEAQAQTSSTESATIKSKTKISKLTVTALAAGKLTATWTVKNPVDGLAYQIKYAKLGSKGVTKTSASTTKTFSKLTGGATYSFRVRAYKKIGGKNVYSKWSKKVSAQAVPAYKKGSYTVKGDLLNVRKTASQAKTSAVLTSIPRGTKVQITKVMIAGGAAWGKVTYNGQTGWVQMQYLK